MATRTGLTPLRYVYAVRCLLLADRPHRFATYAPMGLCGLRSNPTGSRPVYFTTSQKQFTPTLMIRAGVKWQPVRDSNPCCRRERAES